MGRRTMFEHNHRAGSPRIKPGGWKIYRNGQLQHIANMAGDVTLRQFPACLAGNGGPASVAARARTAPMSPMMPRTTKCG
jgi:hypothetical protein